MDQNEKKKQNNPPLPDHREFLLHLLFVTKTQLQIFSCTHVSYYRTRHEPEPKPRFLHSPRGMLQRIYLLLLEQRGKFTALFLADNARKLAAIPTVEMCQLLMGLSIEMPFPEDLRRTDIVVLTVTLQTAGSRALTYQSYHSSSANTPQRVSPHTCPHTRLAATSPASLLYSSSHSLCPAPPAETVPLRCNDRRLQLHINYLVTL